MSNEIGKRGERIFAFIIGKSFAPYGYLFDTVFLGDKYPTVDFYIDLLNYHTKKGFFFASVKTTTQGYTTEKNHLKIFVSKEELQELVKYPVPTYLFGIDAIEEKGYFTCVNHIDTEQNLSSLSLKYPMEPAYLSALWAEVKHFWDNNNSIHSSTSKFV